MATLKDRLARIQSLGLVRAAECPGPQPHPGHEPQFSREPDSEISGKAGLGVPIDSGRGKPAQSASPGESPISVISNDVGVRTEIRPDPASGWEEIAPWLWMREVFYEVAFPPTVNLAAFDLVSPSASGPHAGREVSTSDGTSDAGERRRTLPFSDLRFFDFETTGISGGAGTVAFLAGLGRVEPDGFTVRQYFLSDYPGEAAFVEAVIAGLQGGKCVLTYNGYAFDLPLLRTRCIMNAVPVPELGHVDALFLARRLWKRFHGSVALQNLESRVLGIERTDDVPGFLIPGLWLNWLRTADIDPLAPVFHHNVKDVLTLAKLVRRAGFILEDPCARIRDAPVSPCADPARLGCILLDLGRIEEGESILLSATADGDEVAGLALAKRYLKEDRMREREMLLNLLPETPRCDILRAKHAEHRLKNFHAALQFTERAMSMADPVLHEALEHRRHRLLRRLRREGAEVP